MDGAVVIVSELLWQLQSSYCAVMDRLWISYVVNILNCSWSYKPVVSVMNPVIVIIINQLHEATIIRSANYHEVVVEL